MNFDTNPKWLYKPIKVDNLEAIQKEIAPIILKKIPNFLTQGPEFIHILREDIEPYAPLYVEFIAKFGILYRWNYCAVITTNLGMDFGIHVDSVDWENRCYGLNLPIINCEGTYTVWYDAEIEGGHYAPDDFRSSARMQKPNTSAAEIDRWDMSKPAWINTSIPHRPESTHNRPRAVLSARFVPELHELLY